MGHRASYGTLSLQGTGVVFWLQGKVDNLLADILSVFPVDMIYTPVEHDALPKGAWPSINDFVDLGRHLLFVSASDYGMAMRSLIFPRFEMHLCNHDCRVHTLSTCMSAFSC